MIAALICVMSLAALAQFAVSQWRSIWVTIAAQPLSNSLESATGIANDAIGAEHFEILSLASEQLGRSLHESNLWIKEVKLYHRLLRASRKLSGKALPSVSGWANRELAECAKFAAAMLDRRLNNSLAYGAPAQRP
ncbi:MAG TPA: hypothetical protein VGU63_16965 [Candidatus Acidoferrales bacterium]|nr:hypothetical protein [Candidatus Acidoferrales bacterium]